MLNISSETQAAHAASTCLFARAYGHGSVDATGDCNSRSAVLRVNGPLRTPLDGVLRSRVESLLDGGVRRVLLDLAGVSSIDASGVGELIHVFNTVAAASGVLEIERMSPRVRRLLDVAGVLELLTAGHVECLAARSS